MRKPAFCICENKDADQLRGNREANQRLCFRYIDSAIPLLPIYEISSLKPSCVVVQPGLYGALLETPKTGFLTTGLINNLLRPQLSILPSTKVFVKTASKEVSTVFSFKILRKFNFDIRLGLL